MSGALRIIGVGLLCFGLISTGAHAQDASESDSYARLVRDAVAEYEAGHYEEAAALFERAHVESPSARTHRGLGLAYYESRKYALAVEHLQAALEDQRRALTATQQQEVQNALQHAQQFVVTVKLRLQPDNAYVAIDGNPAVPAGEQSERGTLALLVDAGRHELVTRADGYVEDHRTIDAVTGTQLALEIALTSAGERAAEQTRATSETATDLNVHAGKDSGRRSRLGPLIAMGGGAALLLGALGTGIAAKSAHDDLEQRCPDGHCPPSLQSTRDRGETFMTLTNVLLITGGVAAAAGVGWWFLQPDRQERVTASALCTQHGCAVALQGAL